MRRLLIYILIIAAALRLWGINHQIYTDENKVVTPSVLLAKGQQHPLLYPKGSYYPHFYHYILGVAFLPLALAHLPYPAAGDTLDAYTLTARIVTALIGVLTVWLVYRLGKSLANQNTGLLATAIFALLPLHVKYSHYAHVDVPLTAVALLAMLAAVRIWHTGQRRWYVITGLLVGLCGATHYTGLVMGSALVIAHLAFSWHRSPRTWRTFLSHSFIISLFLIPVGFFLASPYTIIKWSDSIAIYQQLAQRGAAGDLGYTSPNLMWPLYSTTPDWGLPFTVSGMIWEFFPITCLLAIIGLGIAIRQRASLLICLAGIVPVIMYLAIVGHLPLYAVKRLLPVAPFITILAAHAITWLYAQKYKFPVAWRMLAVLLAVSIIIPTAYTDAAFDGAYAGGSTHNQAFQWAQANIPAGSVVLQHTPIRLLDWNDSRFTTVRMDEVYANFNKIDPEVAHDRAKPLSYWINTKHVQYIVMDSRIVDRYYDPTSIKLFPATTASYRAFYDDIRTHATLVFEAQPKPWIIAGPRVEIYDLRQLK
jgi:4-amino-4-deoxy-L-arabinose transferase-like glycosyltransferase